MKSTGAFLHSLHCPTGLRPFQSGLTRTLHPPWPAHSSAATQGPAYSNAAARGVQSRRSRLASAIKRGGHLLRSAYPSRARPPSRAGRSPAPQLRSTFSAVASTERATLWGQEKIFLTLDPPCTIRVDLILSNKVRSNGGRLPDRHRRQSGVLPRPCPWPARPAHKLARARAG